ncbi:MAG: hypothetical protein JSW28_00100 [Thermoplasmata archaeon]|nr:MAG: hypothetical protein JSW28_00100 [Thermoplasmata archaeon]
MDSQVSDGQKLMEMSKERLLDLMLMHIRSLWAVDGLYFLGIEKRFGTESAAEIDRKVWEVMGKIEARRLRETLEIKGDDIPSLIEALSMTTWALDLEHKEIVVEQDRAVFRNTNCRTQKTRISKGLEVFPCKAVRWGYLKTFTKEWDEKIEVTCRVCPPDDHPENLWCEWEFKNVNR